ncbi:MAG TPA: aldo/keto reductase [Phenylobacterium sp.]|uniref:aldo/keto reductase n=1 Tax=Phenylobacterium sp. TaxID=1871053 RepID=UPI002D07D0D1|nr:aldo/keto reductase [Phenylobacterium sp.]HSV04741.1 aldo/keto reductase [Phenylobacterium sp.]
MELRRFGSTGLSVAPLGLGSVNFSWLTDEPTSFQILDSAFERGVNLLDTSDNYNAGRSEALIGRWFAQGGGRREKTVLATKVYSAPMEWGSPDPVRRTGSWVGPNQKGLSAKHIREACEGSLKRLGTDYVDLYQMHHIDRAARWEEIWQAMEVLVAQGKVLYVGSSNFAGWHIAQAQEAARARNFLGLVSEQSVYNLTKRTVELEVLPAARAYGMAFLPYSPLAAGALGGKPEGNDRGRRAYARKDDNVEAYEALCDRIGQSPADVALAWLASRPGVTAPIVGPRTLAQFEANLAAVELRLDDEVAGELDRIFPGPGGPAPEAYAW